MNDDTVRIAKQHAGSALALKAEASGEPDWTAERYEVAHARLALVIAEQLEREFHAVIHEVEPQDVWT